MAKLLLKCTALEELHIVDKQEIDGAKLLFEGRSIPGLERLGEAVHEPLSRKVKHLRIWIALLHLPRDGMQQMGFAHADARMNIKGVIFQRLVGSVLGDLQRSGVGQPVRGADHERLEGVARVER